MDEITLKLNSPITEEQWDTITDVDFDNTCSIWFNTKHGKEVEFTKIVRCKDCKKHNVKMGFDENGHTVWKEDSCPLILFRGKAQGHEFDYQYCIYGERK